jgi:hypothetical protein
VNAKTKTGTTLNLRSLNAIVAEIYGNANTLLIRTCQKSTQRKKSAMIGGATYVGIKGMEMFERAR